MQNLFNNPLSYRLFPRSFISHHNHSIQSISKIQAPSFNLSSPVSAVPIGPAVAGVRYFRNFHQINWVKNRFWARVWWYSHKDNTEWRHKHNHPRVEKRFKVTR